MEIVDGYIVAIRDMLSENSDLNHYFVDMVDKDVFWTNFRDVATDNFKKTDKPELTPEQFKTVLLYAINKKLEKILNDLTDYGIVENQNIKKP